MHYQWVLRVVCILLGFYGKRGSLVDSRPCLVIPGCRESCRSGCTHSRPGRNARNLLGSRSIPLVVWSREDSSSCADCTKSASLAGIVGEWR